MIIQFRGECRPPHPVAHPWSCGTLSSTSTSAAWDISLWAFATSSSTTTQPGFPTGTGVRESLSADLKAGTVDTPGQRLSRASFNDSTHYAAITEVGRNTWPISRNHLRLRVSSAADVGTAFANFSRKVRGTLSKVRKGQRPHSHTSQVSTCPQPSVEGLATCEGPGSSPLK